MKSFALAALATLALAGVGFAQDYLPPPAVTISVATGKTTAAVSWQAPADQCNGNTCAEYDLRYSLSAITECNFTDATRITTSTPSSPTTTECYGLESLDCGTTFYWALKTRDSSGNWSAISNVVTKATKACNTSLEVYCLNLQEWLPGEGRAVRALREADPRFEAPMA